MSEPDPRIAALWRALGTVIDPELGLDIVTLGLVYGVEMDGDLGVVTYTLTSPGCPMEQYITAGIHAAARTVEGLAGIESRLVGEPRWHAGMIARGAWPG
jgi:metal-sulfur cluster biosynthetic enzyme